MQDLAGHGLSRSLTDLRVDKDKDKDKDKERSARRKTRGGAAKSDDEEQQPQRHQRKEEETEEPVVKKAPKMRQRTRSDGDLLVKIEKEKTTGKPQETWGLKIKVCFHFC